jgi:2-phospho-L-lactate guanylyltransferase
MRIVALVPFKALNQAKSRLAGALLPAGRRALARWMGARVVDALRESGVVDRIGLVGADPVLAGRWREDPRVVTVRASGLSLNRDLETGRRWALRQGSDALLVALGDLPLLTGAAVREMVALSGAPSHGQAVVIAPDRRKDGTNLLLMAPPDLLAFSYGRHSLAHHLDAARRAGVEPEIYRAEETSFDVDTSADLARLVARGLWPPGAHELVIGESDAHDEIG